MPFATIDGIPTRYELTGDGPPLLLFSPGGFSAALDNWHTHGLYRRLDLLAHLARRYTCIAFDKRESGESGGRVERITWASYAAQGKGLLDELGIDRAHLMGGCVGCSIAATLAVTHPERVASLVLYSPAGGPRYRMTQHDRFARHLAFVAAQGLPAVAELAADTEVTFTQDPRVGPWCSVLRRDPAFAKSYADGDAGRYATLVTGMARLLFDRDTVPGPEPEDLMGLDIPALIVPGEDASHAPSAARYLQECLPHAEFWNMPVAEQTAATAPDRVLAFLDGI